MSNLEELKMALDEVFDDARNDNDDECCVIDHVNNNCDGGLDILKVLKDLK